MADLGEKPGAGSDRRRAVATAADGEQPNQSITPPIGRISASTSCGMDLAEPLIAGDPDRRVRHDGVVVEHSNGRANPWQPRYRSRIWTSQRQSATPLVWSSERPVYQRRRPRTHPPRVGSVIRQGRLRDRKNRSLESRRKLDRGAYTRLEVTRLAVSVQGMTVLRVQKRRLSATPADLRSN